jgi:hypothetical protein
VITKSIVSSVAHGLARLAQPPEGTLGNGTGFTSSPASGVPIDSGPSAFESRSP